MIKGHIKKRTFHIGDILHHTIVKLMSLKNLSNHFVIIDTNFKYLLYIQKAKNTEQKWTERILEDL